MKTEHKLAIIYIVPAQLNICAFKCKHLYDILVAPIFYNGAIWDEFSEQHQH